MNLTNKDIQTKAVQTAVDALNTAEDGWDVLSAANALMGIESTKVKQIVANRMFEFVSQENVTLSQKLTAINVLVSLITGPFKEL